MRPKNLSPVQVREAVHLLLLAELAKASGGKGVTVKGGVNLRLFFQSARYSEDIDLDGDRADSRQIREVITEAISEHGLARELRRIGISELDPGEGVNKDSPTTLRYKFGVVVSSVTYPTKIEVSFRDRYAGDDAIAEVPDEDVTEPYGLAPVRVQHYVREAAIRQKIEALGGRSHVQARDVFDLAVLIPDSPHLDLLDFLAGGLDPALVELAKARSLEISFEAYKGQVLEFVDEAALSRYGSADVWDEICLRVNGLIEQVRERQEEQ